jgi:hypothetical protein
MSGVKIGGAWKTPSIVYTKVGGQWKIVAQSFMKINGTWRNTTFGSPPASPIMGYVSTGVFNITNYDPTLTYTATLVSGSGTATFNSANGRYTLSGPNSRFSVTASYAPGAPQSSPDFMERAAYTYYTETFTFTGTCSGTRTVDYDCSYNEFFFCCGDPCNSNFQCPPTDGWFCSYFFQCCTEQCVRTVSRTCQREETYTFSCEQTGTRQVKNATPSGFTDSGVEWYRVS